MLFLDGQNFPILIGLFIKSPLAAANTEQALCQHTLFVLESVEYLI